MRAINESNLRLALDSGSTKRLNLNLKAITRDETGRVYDPEAVAVLSKYVKDPRFLTSELQYLRFLTNDDGELFARSKGKYADCELQLSNFQAREKSSFRWNNHYQAAMERVMSRYSQAHLRMVKYESDEDVYRSVTDWSTSMGWTGILTGKTKKRDYLGGVCNEVLKREALAKIEGSFQCPIVCWYRTQGSGAYDHDGNRTNTWKSKKRLVMMVDGYQVMTESRFGEPLTQFMKALVHVGVGKTDAWFKEWIASERRSQKSFISLDFSKFDSTIPSWLIHSAFDVIRSAFTEYDEELLRVVEEDFIHKNILGGWSVTHADHGNPSGSRLTTIINCICNEIITETWLDAFGIEAHYNVMGDDNLLFTYANIAQDSAFVINLSHYIEHNFGIKVNVDKESYGLWRKDPLYLSRFWSDAGPYRCAGEVISMLAYPERPRPYDRPDVQLTPELVLYSYVLAYRKTMDDLMRVGEFLRDVQQSVSHIKWTKEQREAVPYNVRTVVESSLAFAKQKPNLQEYKDLNLISS